MKKKLLFLAALMFFVVVIVTPASAVLINWGFDPDGGGDSIVNIPELWDLTGSATISNDFNTFTFSENGTFESFSFGLPTTGWGSLGYGNPTATFTATGTLAPNEFFFDAVPNSLRIFIGGGEIGVFDLISGGGLLNDDFGPVDNGLITANFTASSLASGYWFTPDGTDMSTLSPISFTLGFATTNASIVNPPVPVFDSQGRLTDFTVSNNGQWRVDVVPEPGTMFLLGAGLIGLASISRKKYFKK